MSEIDNDFIFTSGTEIVIHTTFETDEFKQTEENPLLEEIKKYAELIKCENFHGKGSIDDYSELFISASKIANETKQINIDIDVDGFNEFGKTADDLAKLFDSFIVKLQNVNIINDYNFLVAVLDALKKIVNLSNVFGKFKETILVTSTIKIPKSAQETSVVLENVMKELNCAMNYISNFVVPNIDLPKGQLDENDKENINNAKKTIDEWAVLCEYGMSFALSNNENINKLKNINNDLKTKTDLLKNATAQLKSKFIEYNLEM